MGFDDLRGRWRAVESCLTQLLCAATVRRYFLYEQTHPPPTTSSAENSSCFPRSWSLLSSFSHSLFFRFEAGSIEKVWHQLTFTWTSFLSLFNLIDFTSSSSSPQSCYDFALYSFFRLFLHFSFRFFRVVFSIVFRVYQRARASQSWSHLAVNIFQKKFETILITLIIITESEFSGKSWLKAAKVGEKLLKWAQKTNLKRWQKATKEWKI